MSLVFCLPGAQCVDRTGRAACFVKLFSAPNLISELGANARALANYRLDDTIAAFHALYRKLGR